MAPDETNPGHGADLPAYLGLHQGAGSEHTDQARRALGELVAADQPARPLDDVGLQRAARDERAREPGQDRLDRLDTADQQTVSVPTLRDSTARHIQLGAEVVAIDDHDLGEVIGQHSRGQQPGQTAAEHHRASRRPRRRTRQPARRCARRDPRRNGVGGLDLLTVQM
ncbi:MAG: hypothetical protein HY830_16170 [Actinobacteria bacterium]|nr:hypothetical protein [Actinomycetota bacterium]